jgi:membrane protein implicated in regulation of membrane protease activity
MDVMQTWLLVGVPGLCIAAALFVGRSIVRAWLGYAVLAALIVLFVTTPGGSISAALIGAIAVVFVANGSGTNSDRAYREHHEERGKYTRAQA